MEEEEEEKEEEEEENKEVTHLDRTVVGGPQLAHRGAPGTVERLACRRRNVTWTTAAPPPLFPAHSFHCAPSTRPPFTGSHRPRHGPVHTDSPACPGHGPVPTDSSVLPWWPRSDLFSLWRLLRCGRCSGLSFEDRRHLRSVCMCVCGWGGGQIYIYFKL